MMAMAMEKLGIMATGCDVDTVMGTAMETRMHSSRMRTFHSSSRLLPGGMSARGGGVSAPGGCLLLGGGIPACTEADPPPWTDRCKNITFATSLRTVKIEFLVLSIAVAATV